MKKQIFFAHSAGPQGPGQGSHDLLSMLRTELSHEYEIISPLIERPNAPDYQQWRKVLKAAFAASKEPLILIGHSLGGSVLLKYLSEEKPDIRIQAMFLIAMPHWGAPDWEVDEFVLEKNFSDALRNIPAIYLYYSEDDEMIPMQHLTFYRNAMKNAVIRKLKGYSHEFNTGLPELVQDLIGSHPPSPPLEDEQRRLNQS
jgi:predicted alpha/beta hydrolase family esterase